MILSRKGEELSSHIQRVLEQYNQLVEYKDINIILTNIINKLCSNNTYLKGQNKVIYNLFYQSLRLHDEGKKNPYFQSFMANKDYKGYHYNNINRYHTEISAIYYIIEMYEQYATINNFQGSIIEKKLKQKYIKDLIICFAYNIYVHHTGLSNINKNQFINFLIDYYEKNTDKFINIDLKNIQNLYKFKNISNIDYSNPYIYYFFNKFTYSILVNCDFMAVYSFYNKENFAINIINEKIKKNIENKFNSNEVVKNIRQYQNNKNFPLSKINKYRSNMFLESEINLINNRKSHLYYLEAPTGSGKSLTSLNLALHSLNGNINKIYYISPLNCLSSQTYETMKKTFYKNTVIVNSKEDIFISNNQNGSVNYDKDFLNMQMINYPVSLISHVRFFDVLFSYNRISNLMLSTLCNSVIIVDEIQNYKNSIWIEMINSIKEVAELLNIKIIIMSATLPKMQMLLEDKNYYIPSLIKNREVYYNFFKQRVTYNFDFLKKDKNTIPEIIDKIDYHINKTNKNRILIECLTTKTMEKFYYQLVKYKEKGYLVYKMSSITNDILRQKIVSIIQGKDKNGNYINKKIILIGTQTIEAGLDIDMQVGFKDISMLDSDEQFCGRIERNFKNVGIIYFFNIDSADFIYRNDYRITKDLKNEEWQQLFINKDFNKFYQEDYKWLLQEKNKQYKNFKKGLNDLQYKEISDLMRLIDNATYSLLFLCKYKNKESAEDIYNKYINVKDSDIKYSEKQIKLSKIKKELNNYIYNINTFKFKNNDILYEKENGLYIIDNGYKYFDNLTKDNELNNDSSLNIDDFCEEAILFV